MKRIIGKLGLFGNAFKALIFRYMVDFKSENLQLELIKAMMRKGIFFCCFGFSENKNSICLKPYFSV